MKVSKTVSSKSELERIPGVGPSIAKDLERIGVTRVSDLIGASAESLYELSNKHAGVVQDRCLLYVFRCAVYFAEHEQTQLDPEKCKWWNWKDIR